MSTSEITAADMKLTRQCLIAAVEGPFFPGDDFHTLIGLNRSKVKEIIYIWPKIDFRDEDTIGTIASSLGNLTGYPHGEEGRWAEFIDASPEEVDALFLKWKQVGEMEASTSGHARH